MSIKGLRFCLTIVASILFGPIYISPTVGSEKHRDRKLNLSDGKGTHTVIEKDETADARVRGENCAPTSPEDDSGFYDAVPVLKIFETFYQPPPPKILPLTPNLEADMLRRLNEMRFPRFPKLAWENYLIDGTGISYVRSYNGSKCLDRECGSETYLGWMNRPVVLRTFSNECHNVVTMLKEVALTRCLADMDIVPHLVGLVPLEKSDTFLPHGVVTEYVPGPEYGGFENRLDRILSHDAEAHRKPTKIAALLTRKEWTKVVLDLCLAMRSLHKKRLVQGRIRAGNIQLRRQNGEWRPLFIRFNDTVTTQKASRFQKEMEDFGRLLREFHDALEFGSDRMANWCLGKYHDRPSIEDLVNFCRNAYYSAIDGEKTFVEYTGQEVIPVKNCINYANEPNPDWLEIVRRMASESTQ